MIHPNNSPPLFHCFCVFYEAPLCQVTQSLAPLGHQPFFSTLQDGDGFITLAELSKVMADLGHTHLSQADLMEMIKEADLDKDGKISLSEFKVILKTW